MAYNRESWIKGNVLRDLPLSDITENILVGTLLGDACLVKVNKKSSYIALHHSIKQLEYLKWKADNMKELFIQPLVITNQTFVNKGNNLYNQKYKGNTSYACEVRSICRSDLDKYASLDFLLSKLNLISIGVWYGDDGWLSKSKIKMTKGKPYVSYESAMFELGNRNIEDVTKIKIHLKNMGIDCSVLKRNHGKYWRLYLKKEATKFCLDKFQFLPECLQYKLKS